MKKGRTDLGYDPGMVLTTNVDCSNNQQLGGLCDLGVKNIFVGGDPSLRSG
jgi:hypothetical protein